VQDQERDAKDGEGVFRAELAVADVHIELLGEAADRGGRQVPGRRVDIAEVVAGLAVAG
jgi:hypothetical protein